MEAFWKLNWTIILIPLIIGFYNYRKLSKALKYLLYFVGYGTFNQIVNYTLIKTQSKNTLFLVHIYAIMAFIALGFFYKEVFKGFINGQIANLLIISFGLYVLLNALFLQSIFEYPSLPLSIFAIVFLLASIVFFYKTMLEAAMKNLWSEPMIWINVAVLIYYAGILFYFILFNLVLEYSMEFAKQVSIFFNVSNAIFYILIAIGFWKAGKQKIVKTS